ncbi:MAG: START-like domain-containing protein [Bacteroidales bacterium]
MEKEQFNLEFSFKSSPKILYNRISTPSGLSEWFADDVNVVNQYKTYVFVWDGYDTPAHVLAQKENSHIRFQWEEDEGEDYYFEFKISIDDLTGDVALVITDYAEPDEKEDAIQLWESQIEQLKHVVGS